MTENNLQDFSCSKNLFLSHEIPLFYQQKAIDKNSLSNIFSFVTFC
jgi:hypothetical protein